MDKAEKFWDNAAGNYDQEEDKDAQTFSLIIEKTRTYLKPDNVVFDFGCGTGRVSNEFAGEVKEIYAVDISSKMIEIAKAKAGQRNIENIDYAQASLFDESFPAGSFDAVLAFYILHLVDDPSEVIHRLHALLKPGGLLISATPCLGEAKFQYMLLSLLSKFGLVPGIRPFKSSELVSLITTENFEIIEKEPLQKTTAQYFMVAKKLPRPGS